LLGRPGSEAQRSLAAGGSNYRIGNEVIICKLKKVGTGRHRQLHRLEVFDRHEYAEKPREKYVLMRTKSALSGTRRADVAGFGVRTGTKFPTNKYVR
jgi:hypothetical protein